MGIAIGFVMGMIIILMSAMKAAYVPYIIIIALAFAFMVYRVNHLVLRINQKYDKIEM